MAAALHPTVIRSWGHGIGRTLITASLVRGAAGTCASKTEAAGMVWAAK